MSDAHAEESGTIFKGFGTQLLGLVGLGGEHAAHGAAHEHSKFDHYIEELSEWGISRGLMFWVLFIGLMSILNLEIPHFGIFTLEWLAGTAPIWMPVFFAVLSWNVWMIYVQAKWISGREPMLYEIKIPREITKSPRAMEMMFEAMFTQSGETNFIDRGFKGQVRPSFSFEYVSFGGEVHFYFWSWKNFAMLPERALYAVYPEIEIHSVEDYASKFNFDPNTFQIWAMEYKLANPDMYPIRTYIDFELDKDPKEEFKIEPLSEMFEFLGSLKPTEQVWIQIIIRADGKSGVLRQKSSEWKTMVEKEVEAIRDKESLTPGETLETIDKTKQRFPRPTWKQTEQIKAMERNLGKTVYQVGIRSLYIADIAHGSFSGPTLGMLRNVWRPLGNAQYMNSLIPTRGHHVFDWPWQDLHDFRHKLVSKRFLDAYRRRSYFYHPWIAPHHLMSTEALATLFHFPSSTIVSPGIQRISATKAEPPQNLPK